jgi:hypothetical protein
MIMFTAKGHSTFELTHSSEEELGAHHPRLPMTCPGLQVRITFMNLKQTFIAQFLLEIHQVTNEDANAKKLPK